MLVHKGACYLEQLVSMSKFLSNFHCFANQGVEQSTQGKWNGSPTANYMSSICRNRHWCACKETPDLLVDACTQNQSWNWHLLTRVNKILLFVNSSLHKFSSSFTESAVKLTLTESAKIIMWKHLCCWTAAGSVTTLFYTAAYFNQTKENVVYNSEANCTSNTVYFNWSRNIDILIILF